MDMKDMSKASSRIYVGNLSDAADSDALFEQFKSYGNILGIKRPMKKTYAFVQFDSDDSALEAIKNENQKMFGNRSLIVRAAVTNHKAKDNNQNDNSETPMNDNQSTGQAHNASDNSYMERSERRPQNRGFRGDSRYPPARPLSGYRDRSPVADDWDDHERHATYDRYATDTYQQHAPAAPERNDCEIIVVSKQLTGFAEYIEDRLKRIGLTVDLLFPNEDVPIGRVLGNILSRGSIYAVLVMPQNEENRSLTLNILHGLPQEHRNMPLEDAITLIARNFAEIQRNGSTAGNEAVNALLNQVANGRSLTVTQYDRVLEYIKECRDKQIKMELGDSSSGNNADKVQVDLQQRILSILNSETKIADTKSTQPSGPQPLMETKVENPNYDNAVMLREKIASMLNNSAIAQGPVPQPVAAPNLKTAITNPTIQKALDSLLNKMT